MRSRPYAVVSVIFSMAGYAATASAQELALAEFLEAVRAKNTGIAGSAEVSQGSQLRSEEGFLQFSPAFFANAQLSSDASQKLNPALMGTRTIFNTYSAGFSQQTPFGMQARLYYNNSFTSLEGVNRAFVPQSVFNDGKVAFEIAQPLWRNGFGREARASANANRQQALGSAAGELFRIRAILVDAEAAYWRLSFARELVEIQRDSYERALKLRDWSRRRVESRLADPIDLMQADAALKVRELELVSAKNELRAASLAFNAQRDIASDVVLEELEPIRQMDPDTIEPIDRAPLRLDVQAALHQQEAAAEVAAIARERNLPTLELFGSAALTNRGTDFSDSLSGAFDTENPVGAVGLRFSVPLDFSLTSDNRRGAAKEALGYELKYRRKVFDQDKEWSDLVKRLEESKARWAVAWDIERLQRQKYEREKERHAQGRSTTFLVLQFEQDFALSQLNRLKTQFEALAIAAQMKLFLAEDSKDRSSV